MWNAFFLALLFAVLVVSPSLAHAETVSGTNFELRGPNGAMTAQLTTSGEGTPSLFMYDAMHTVRISIGLYPDGAPGVVLNDDTGRAAAIVRLVQSSGGPVLVLKENGQDKLIIDKNGLPASPASGFTIWSSLFAFIAGIIGSALHSYAKGKPLFQVKDVKITTTTHGY